MFIQTVQTTDLCNKFVDESFNKLSAFLDKCPACVAQIRHTTYMNRDFLLLIEVQHTQIAHQWSLSFTVRFWEILSQRTFLNKNKKFFSFIHKIKTKPCVNIDFFIMDRALIYLEIVIPICYRCSLQFWTWLQ